MKVFTMLSSIFPTVIFLLCFHWTVAVNMCTNRSSVSTDLTLNLIKGTGVSGCYCSVKLHNADQLGSVKPRIIFETVQFSGCKYNFVILYEKTSTRFSCSNNSPIFHDINKTDEIQLYLESTSSQDDTEFEVKITSRDTGPLLRLECFPPNANLITTTRTPTPSTERTTTTLTPGTRFSRVTIAPLSTTRSTEDMNTMDSSTKQDIDDGSCNDYGVVTAGIIGGVIGVVIGGVTVGVLIFIITYLKKKRKKNSTSEIYSSPSRHQPESQYTDLQLS